MNSYSCKNNFSDHNVKGRNHTTSISPATATSNMKINSTPASAKTTSSSEEQDRKEVDNRQPSSRVTANLTTNTNVGKILTTTTVTSGETILGRDTTLKSNLTYPTDPADTTTAAAVFSNSRIEQMLFRPNFKYISPNSNGKNTDWGGVPSICSSWDQQLSNHQNEVAGILFNNSDWICQPNSLGNKLGLYFQARTFAALHGIQFHIYPQCSKEDQFDNLIAWLPQNVFVDKNSNNVQNDSFVTTSNITTTLERMCKCHGPIAHQCKEGWPILSNTWHYEIRSALKDWASSSLLLSSANQTTTARSTGTTIEKGVATIHFRCGDILDPDVIARGETLGMGFLRPSFYYKHLKGRNVTAVHIITTPLSSCSNNTLQREQDCKHGPSCKRVLDALITRLSSLMNRPKDIFKIYDNESSLWSMHHIVFSDVSFCSPSTFCLFSSLGSNYAIHSSSAVKFPAIGNSVPRALNGTFEYDDDVGNDYLIDVSKLPPNGTVEKVIDLMMQ